MKKGRKYAKRKKTTPRVESKKLSDSEIFCRNLKKRLNGISVKSLMIKRKPLIQKEKFFLLSTKME